MGPDPSNNFDERDCGDRHLGGASDGQAYRSGRLVQRAAYCSGWLLILAAQSFNERPDRAGFMIAVAKLCIAAAEKVAPDRFKDFWR